MSRSIFFLNHLRDRRSRRGWSQQELARRSGLARTEVSAIENNRLVPSTAVALALASALECRVEDLFCLPGKPASPSWAWPPNRPGGRYWAAEVGGTTRFYPVEPTAQGMIPHDGVESPGTAPVHDRSQSERTLVMACCDPAVGLLASRLAITAGVRLLALPRPSRKALALLGQGQVHVAGVHLSAANNPDGNARIVQEVLGPGYSLVRAARWEEGLALPTDHRFRSARSALRASLRWIGREPGSGARECLDELSRGRAIQPAGIASDHRGVAEAVRSGWADAGVCLRLITEEAGLAFLGIREEAYDLCFPASLSEDPRIRALMEVVRSPSYRRSLGELPGYDSLETGTLTPV